MYSGDLTEQKDDSVEVFISTFISLRNLTFRFTVHVYVLFSPRYSKYKYMRDTFSKMYTKLLLVTISEERRRGEWDGGGLPLFNLYDSAV